MSRLVEIAKHLVVPDGAVATGWPSVRDTCRNLGWGFDEWQDDLGRLILAKNVAGFYAAVLVALSLCRQVGKTYLVGCIVFALCLLRPGTKVIWTAHRSRTASETFRSMKAKAKSPELAPFIDQRAKGGGIRSANGEQEIEFLNGSRIMFGAREAGFGVGFAEVDILVLDEVQRATVKAMDDLLPTTNASQNPLVLCMGTPPRPTDDGEVFTMLRSDAITGESSDVLYVELGATHRFDLTDEAEFWRQLRQVNPSFPHRVGERAILRNRKGLSDDSVFREVFGLWDEDSGRSLVPMSVWRDRRVDMADAPDPTEPPTAIALDLSPQGTIAICGVWRMPEGRMHGEVLSLGEHTQSSAVTWLRDHARRDGRRIPVVVDGASPAAALVPGLKQAKVRLIVTNATDMGRACVGWHSAVVEGLFSYCSPTSAGSDPLDRAVSGAKKRLIRGEGAWGVDKKDDTVDLAVLVALILAHYGAALTKPRTGAGRTNGNRVGVVM